MDMVNRLVVVLKNIVWFSFVWLKYKSIGTNKPSIWEYYYTTLEFFFTNTWITSLGIREIDTELYGQCNMYFLIVRHLPNIKVKLLD